MVYTYKNKIGNKTPNTTHQYHNHIITSPSSAIYARKSKDDEDDEGSDKVEINPAKRAALDGVLQRIERNYGRGSIVKLGDADRMVVDCIGSGSMTLGEFVCDYITCIEPA